MESGNPDTLKKEAAGPVGEDTPTEKDQESASAFLPPELKHSIVECVEILKKRCHFDKWELGKFILGPWHLVPEQHTTNYQYGNLTVAADSKTTSRHQQRRIAAPGYRTNRLSGHLLCIPSHLDRRRILA